MHHVVAGGCKQWAMPMLVLSQAHLPAIHVRKVAGHRLAACALTAALPSQSAVSLRYTLAAAAAMVACREWWSR